MRMRVTPVRSLPEALPVGPRGVRAPVGAEPAAPLSLLLANVRTSSAPTRPCAAGGQTPGHLPTAARWAHVLSRSAHCSHRTGRVHIAGASTREGAPTPRFGWARRHLRQDPLGATGHTRPPSTRLHFSQGGRLRGGESTKLRAGTGGGGKGGLAHPQMLSPPRPRGTRCSR